MGTMREGVRQLRIVGVTDSMTVSAMLRQLADNLASTCKY